MQCDFRWPATSGPSSKFGSYVNLHIVRRPMEN